MGNDSLTSYSIVYSPSKYRETEGIKEEETKYTASYQEVILVNGIMEVKIRTVSLHSYIRKS